jgi:hypothetical protein
MTSGAASRGALPAASASPSVLSETQGSHRAGPARGDIDSLVDDLLGSRRPESVGDITPASSVPGTPALGGQATLRPAFPLSPSGRASRQSDFFGSERPSLGTTLAVSHGATESLIDRYVPRTPLHRGFTYPGMQDYNPSLCP